MLCSQNVSSVGGNDKSKGETPYAAVIDGCNIIILNSETNSKDHQQRKSIIRVLDTRDSPSPER